MGHKKPTLTYRILRALGFNYPIEDYGDISITKVVGQTITNIYHRFLCKLMNSTLLEPFNPRKLRPWIMRRLGANVGKNVFIGEYVRPDLNHSNLITIEDGVHIAADVRFLCHKKDLSGYCLGDIYGQQPYKYGEIHLCKNCAIGTGSLVMPGVTVGEGAVVGAGSLITKDIPAWTMAVGRPAKVVKETNERVKPKEFKD